MLQGFIVIEHNVKRTKSDFEGNKDFFLVTAIVLWRPWSIAEYADTKIYS
jgi:hypothetical protein